MSDENERVDAILVKIWDWDRKIDIIKLVRETTGLGIAEGRHFIENLPQIVKSNIPLEEAEPLRRRFSELGAALDLRSASQP